MCTGKASRVSNRITKVRAPALRPEFFLFQLLFLIEEIKVKLSNLELADITIGIETGAKLDVIFHMG